MNDTQDSFSLVLFSGTDDKLSAAAVMVAGAAVMGRKVNVFVQYWALDAFRADGLHKDHGVVPEAGEEGRAAIRRHEERGEQHWSETLAQAKEIGEVTINACSLSMDMFGLTKADLAPLVDGVEGVASFMAEVDSSVVFI